MKNKFQSMMIVLGFGLVPALPVFAQSSPSTTSATTSSSTTTPSLGQFLVLKQQTRQSIFSDPNLRFSYFTTMESCRTASSEGTTPSTSCRGLQGAARAQCIDMNLSTKLSALQGLPSPITASSITCDVVKALKDRRQHREGFGRWNDRERNG